MPQDALYVSVSWREIQILEEVPLSAPSQEDAFLVTDAPLPVGTMLIISPSAAEEIRVPARVVHGQEALTSKHTEPKTPGMKLVFEAAGELLEPFLPGAEQEQVDGAGETANVEAAGEEADDDFSQDAIPQSASRASGDYAEITDDAMVPEPALGDPDPDAYDEEEDEEEELQYELSEPGHIAMPMTAAGAMDSAISPQASGEINLSRMGGGRYGGDPEAPDKVIVEVEDAAMKAATTDDDDMVPFDDREEDTKVDKPRKKRGRGRKKKKKKK